MMTKKFVRPLVVATATVAVLSGILASPALAEKSPFPPFEPPTWAGETQVCDFPVRLDVVVNKVFVQQRPNGTQQTSGRLIFRLTNLNNRHSVDRQVNGPQFIDGATTTLSGLSLINVFPGNDDTPEHITGTNGYGLFIVSGPSVFSGVKLVQVGHVKEDLCATLA